VNISVIENRFIVQLITGCVVAPALC